MPNKVRRIVTHINADGTSGATESIITKKSLFDETGTPVFEGIQLWGTEDGVPAVGGADQPDEGVFVPFFPGHGGHRFVVFSFMPEVQDGSDGGSQAGGAGESLPRPDGRVLRRPTWDAQHGHYRLRVRSVGPDVPRDR